LMMQQVEMAQTSAERSSGLAGMGREGEVGDWVNNEPRRALVARLGLF
jgi:hypothetical protein